MKKTVKRKAASKKKSAAKKKPAARKTVARKKPAKKAAPAAKPIAKAKKAYSKTELLGTIADRTGIAKKDVGAVLDGLGEVIEAHIKKGAIGQFNLPGLLKVKTVRKPATKARKGINPFTGEETIFKAKPARTVVKVLPLKKMKEMTA